MSTDNTAPGRTERDAERLAYIRKNTQPPFTSRGLADRAFLLQLIDDRDSTIAAQAGEIERLRTAATPPKYKAGECGLHGDHGGPLCSMKFIYEDGTVRQIGHEWYVRLQGTLTSPASAPANVGARLRAEQLMEIFKKYPDHRQYILEGALEQERREGAAWAANVGGQPEAGALPSDTTRRAVSHDEAARIARRPIAASFRRDGDRLPLESTPRFSIPCRPEHDDDCLILAYIKQQRAAPPPPIEDAGAGGDSQSARDMQREVNDRIMRDKLGSTPSADVDALERAGVLLGDIFGGGCDEACVSLPCACANELAAALTAAEARAYERAAQIAEQYEVARECQQRIRALATPSGEKTP